MFCMSNKLPGDACAAWCADHTLGNKVLGLTWGKIQKEKSCFRFACMLFFSLIAKLFQQLF